MSIKGGQILHVAGNDAGSAFVVDRIQTGGVTGINVNESVIQELGNYQNVGTVRDTPDLTFELESFDVTTELESILLGGDNTEAAGAEFDLASYVPIDVISPYKNKNLFTVAGGVIIPFLSLESMSYNMALTDEATMTATLRGDSMFFVPGSVWRETFTGDSIQDTFTFTDGPAYASVIAGDTYYGLSVTVDGVRQRLGTDYTNTATGIICTPPPATSAVIAVVYGSGVASSYLQTVHNDTDPAGVRGRNILVQLGDGEPSPTWSDWLGVQAATVDWRVTLERDEEFGNSQVVSQDFDTPEVSGSLSMKPAYVSSFMAQIQAVAGVTGTSIANITQDPPELQVRFIIQNPADGVTMKTLYIPDAKFTLPSAQGQVGQKLETDFAFTSATGVLSVFKGAMA